MSWAARGAVCFSWSPALRAAAERIESLTLRLHDGGETRCRMSRTEQMHENPPV